MAITYVDPKTAQWAVERQDALLDAEEILQRLVRIHAIGKQMDLGLKVKKADAEFHRKNKSSVWRRAANVVKELDRTHPKRWDKNRV